MPTRRKLVNGNPGPPAFFADISHDGNGKMHPANGCDLMPSGITDDGKLR
jgi:hypothetical protein